MIMYASDSDSPSGYSEVEVDDDDFYTLVKRCWYVNDKGYVATNDYPDDNPKKTLYMHRVIMGAEGFNNVVDHINFMRADNRRCNLRIIDRAANVRHRKGRVPNKGNLSAGVRGVSWNARSHKWLARVCFKGKTFSSYFMEKEEAADWAASKRAELGF